jgi:hypothetical protein
MAGTYHSLNPPYVVGDDLLFSHFVPEFSPIAAHSWLLRGLWMPAPAWLQAYPWRNLHVQAWQPTLEWKLPYVNVWWDGSPISVVIALSLVAAIGICFVWMRPVED